LPAPLARSVFRQRADSSLVWPIAASAQLAQKRRPLRHDALGQIARALFQGRLAQRGSALLCTNGKMRAALVQSQPVL